MQIRNQTPLVSYFNLLEQYPQSNHIYLTQIHTYQTPPQIFLAVAPTRIFIFHQPDLP